MTQIYPHRIRLRGPWEYQPLTPREGTVGRMTMPCRWGDGGLASFAGTVRFLRRFHWPSAIDPLERIWLTLAGVTGSADLSLNEHPLAPPPETESFELEVTRFLQARNVLRVDLTADTPSAGLWGEVALEVRRTAYLQDVRIESASTLKITGSVVGTADRPLELYVLTDNATAHYQTIQADSHGRHFDISIQPPQPPRQVRVELIDGGVVWYHVEWDSV